MGKGRRVMAASPRKRTQVPVPEPVSEPKMIDIVLHSLEDAKAEIKGDKIIVRSDQVPKPKEVRYAWANHPVCNLFNKDGLPASPFRTDDFQGVTQPKR